MKNLKVCQAVLIVQWILKEVLYYNHNISSNKISIWICDLWKFNVLKENFARKKFKLL